MMSNIPLRCFLGAFALVSLTGCDVFANKGFCQKTDQGYEICIKKENISCEEKTRDYWNTMPGPGLGKHVRYKKYMCAASGISKSLTGEENHWVGEDSDSACRLDKKGNLDSSNSYEWSSNITSGRITCGAAYHFGMVKEY